MCCLTQLGRLWRRPALARLVYRTGSRRQTIAASAGPARAAKMSYNSQAAATTMLTTHTHTHTQTHVGEDMPDMPLKYFTHTRRSIGVRQHSARNDFLMSPRKWQKQNNKGRKTRRKNKGEKQPADYDNKYPLQIPCKSHARRRVTTILYCNVCEALFPIEY